MEHDTPSFSRRALVKAGAGLAAAALIGRQASAADAGLRFARQPAINLRQRLLLKGGTIISMDARIGNLAKGDVLIEGTKIAAVGANLSAGGAQTFDASNMILIPGFVDCHRHSWEGQLRRINPNAPTLAEYSNATHLSFATH
ncbi:MAG: 5-methylthioadenosine/S-adenosylhomocysteine deaminase, partial [Alphaproteobacteria bacterium]|nr:5-methylthioadenosine/S-adenosylhomocysteine deaminase [Alphaproteobacteria bacterium]